MMNSSQIERFRRYLELHREQALRALNRLGDPAPTSDPDYAKHRADLCATSLSQEPRMLSQERVLLLRLIEAALSRMQDGTYGVCTSCGGSITPRRLDALPWTQYCLQCQQVRERRPGTEESPPGAAMRLRKAG